MQGEFRKILRDQGDEPGIVRARTHLGKNHLVALDEEFDAEKAAAAERRRHRASLTLRFGQRARAHRLRLPRFAIVALLLTMADRCAVTRAADVADGEQRDFVVEIDESFDDAAALPGTSARLRVFPRGFDVLRAAHEALAFAGAAHYGLDHARQTERRDRSRDNPREYRRNDTAKSEGRAPPPRDAGCLRDSWSAMRRARSESPASRYAPGPSMSACRSLRSRVRRNRDSPAR